MGMRVTVLMLMLMRTLHGISPFLSGPKRYAHNGYQNLGVTNYSLAHYSTLQLAQPLASLSVVSHPPGANRSSQSDERL
ncbi:hypothetical protein NSPZN2_50020 [Nitrospira defluvii]|uniref:Secreted protein n=1 Tax=Nitrospira defluvii TaxID=330214 RepID=A0ABN7M8R1_9BACT|nr:hypothetical protein NSPZN2_50020 [Nitrospira defluvii]